MFNFNKSKPQVSPADKQGPHTIKIADTTLSVIKGDITEIKVAAIVSETNTHLYMEDGLAAAVKRRAGVIVEEEASRVAPVKIGEVALTSGGKLSAQYIIHAVTMGIGTKINESIIRRAAYHSLLCAQKNNITSVAFPVLGRESGDISYDVVSKIMAQEVFRYINGVESPVVSEIFFVAYSDDVYDTFCKNVCEYLNHMMAQGPFLTVDGIVEYEGGLVMVERSNPPFGWALPGGFVDYNETLEEAVAREVKEEINLDFVEFSQFKAYSNPARDPRFHTVSMVFAGKGMGKLKAASDARQAKVFAFDALPGQIAFDHKHIISEYLATKAKL